MSQSHTVTISQALQSQANNLLVLDSALNIATALPNPGLVARVASFTLSSGGTLTAAYAEQLAHLGGKFHLGGFQFTVRDTVAGIDNPANAGGVALAGTRQVADAAFNLLSAPPGTFTHVNSVTLLGAPSLSVAQLSRLEALPHFSIDPNAHVTLVDTLSNIAGVLAANPAWFAALTGVDILLDGSAIGAYAATQIAGLQQHGKTVIFTPIAGHTTLPVTATAHNMAANAAGLMLLANHIGITYTVSDPNAAVSATDAASLVGLHNLNPAQFALSVADSGANISAHLASVFGHGFTAVVVSLGTLAANATLLLDPSLRFNAGATATLNTSATVTAATATALAALPGFAETHGTLLSVVDTPSQLLALGPQALSFIAATTLSQNNAVLTAAQAEQLTLLPNFSTGGNSVAVVDSIANLTNPANEAWSSIATLTGVLDSAANLAAHAADRLVQNAFVVIQQGNAEVTATQATELASIPHFHRSGSALQVTDSAAAIAAAASAIAAVATLAEVNDSGPVTTAQADALDTLAVDNKLVFLGGDQLTVADSFAALTDNANSTGLSLAARVTVADTGANLAAASAHDWGGLNPAYVLTADGSVSAAQATALAGLGNRYNAADHTLTMNDNAAQVLANSAALGALSITAIVTDTAADLAAASVNLLHLGTALHAVIVADDGPVDAATAAGVAPLAAYLTGNRFMVADNAANTEANFAALTTLSSHVEIVVTDNAAAVGAQVGDFVTLGNALAVQLTDREAVTADVATALAPLADRLFNASHLSVLDSTANIVADAATLASLGGALAWVTVNDSTVITAAQAEALLPIDTNLTQQFTVNDSAAALFANADGVFGLLENRKLGGVTDSNDRAASVVNFNGLLNDLGATVSVRDSADNVAAALDGLATVVGLSGITLTDGGTPALAVSLPQLSIDAGVLARINSPYSLSVTATASAITADLTGGNSVLVADATRISSLTASDEGTVTLSAAQLLAPGIDSAPGDALSHYHGALAVTGATVADLATIAGLQTVPTAVAISDTGANISADLAMGGGSEVLSLLNGITSIAVSDGGAVQLTAAQTLAAGVDDGPGSALALITDPQLNVYDAAIDQLGALGSLQVSPVTIAVSDTGAAIQAAITDPGSALFANLPIISSIVDYDGGVITLTEGQLLAPHVDDGSGSIMSLLTGRTLITGVPADDIALVFGLPTAPTWIDVADTAQNIASDLATLLDDLQNIIGITITGGGVLALTADQALTPGVADGEGSIVARARADYTVTDATVAQLVSLFRLAYGPASIAVADGSDQIAADLARGRDSQLLGDRYISTITVAGGVLTLPDATAATLADNEDTTLRKLLPGTIVHVTGAPLSDLALVATLDAAHVTIDVTDNAKTIADDLLGNFSLLTRDSALIAGVTLTAAGGTLSGAELNALAAITNLNANDVALSVSDTAQAIADLSDGARTLAANVAIIDNAGDVGAVLDALQALYAGHLSITLTGNHPVIAVNAATYSADQATLDAITNPGAVRVTGSAADIATLAPTLAADPAVRSVTVTDSAYEVVSNIAALQALGNTLSITLTDESLAAAYVVPLLSIANLNTNGVGVADTANQIAALVETGNGQAIAFLNEFGATLTANSYISVADTAAIGSLTRFNKANHTTIVWDTAAHLTAPGAFAILTNGVQDGIYLKTTNGSVTLTAATAVALFAIPSFNSANPDNSPNAITVADTAAHIDALHTQLQMLSGSLAQIVVDASGVISDATLGDLQSLDAIAANGVMLGVRDTAATIAANAPGQAQNRSITPATWALNGSATVTAATAVILGNLAHFVAGPYVLTIAADAWLSVNDANALGVIAGSIATGGHTITVSDTVDGLSALTPAALSLITPDLFDNFAQITTLAQDSPLLTGTVSIVDGETINATQAAAFLSLIKTGNGPGINPDDLNFRDNTETVRDNVANMRGFTASLAWTAHGSVQSHFSLQAADTVAALIDPANTAFLAGLNLTTLTSGAITDAASAEALAAAATQIHFTLGDNALTVADTAINILNPANSDGLALATSITLSGAETVTAADAESLLRNEKFVLGTELTVSDSSANLLDGVLSGIIADSVYANHVQVELAAPETLDAHTAASLVALPGFIDPAHELTIADSSSYLLQSANLTAEQIAGSVNLAGDETVSANTILRLSEVPHFTAGDSTLTLAGNDFADAATLKAVADLGANFNEGGYRITLTQDALALTPTEFTQLQNDTITDNGHLVSAVLVDTGVTDTNNILSLTATGVAGATINIYRGDGHLISATPEQHAGFIISTPDNNAAGFSITETVNGAESAPVVVLDATLLEQAVATASAQFATSGSIAVDPGKYLNLYTAGSVPDLQAPALVYDPNTHTIALDIPGNAPVTLITLGASTHPATLDVSEILVKHQSPV